MDGKEILKEFELEKGYDPITTSDCELTNWLIKKLIEARLELSKLHLDDVSNLDACKHSFYHVENRDVVICTGCNEIIGDAAYC